MQAILLPLEYVQAMFCLLKVHIFLFFLFLLLFSTDWAISFTSTASVPDYLGICRFWSV